jgi:hypothetical protein
MSVNSGLLKRRYCYDMMARITDIFRYSFAMGERRWTSLKEIQILTMVELRDFRLPKGGCCH